MCAFRACAYIKYSTYGGGVSVSAEQLLGGEGRGVYVLMSGLDIERGCGAAAPLG